MFIMFATAEGSTAGAGSSSEASPFTAALAKHFCEPVKIEKLSKIVRREVAGKTKNMQVPWDSSGLVNDFYFVAPEVKEPPRKRSK